MLTRNKLYVLLLGSCATGYIWIASTFYFHLDGKNGAFGVCLLKHTTNIPCPSCGSTRSVISLLKGNWIESVLINPFGLLITAVLLVAPIWVLLDFYRNKNSLFEFYTRMEEYFKKRWIAIPMIVLVILNWIWNINKGL